MNAKVNANNNSTMKKILDVASNVLFILIALATWMFCAAKVGEIAHAKVFTNPHSGFAEATFYSMIITGFITFGWNAVMDAWFGWSYDRKPETEQSLFGKAMHSFWKFFFHGLPTWLFWTLFLIVMPVAIFAVQYICWRAY